MALVTKFPHQGVEFADDVLCNQCGESLCPKTERAWLDVPLPDPRRRCLFYGLTEAGFRTGYFSDVLPDEHTYRFSLCETCAKALMLGFKIPATQRDVHTDEIVPFTAEEDQKRASRLADAQALADGTMTREELATKNVFAPADRFEVDFDGAKPLK